MNVTNPIIVLGMHRSGTSCLTGCLEEAGLFLGEVNTKAPFNLKGNRKNLSAMKLHDVVLAGVGASWDKPPDSDPVWEDNELMALGEIINGYENIPIWGLKDPRAMFMMNGWRSLLSPKHIGTFRHPVEVANSLMNRATVWRQEMSRADAYKLWATYNRRMLNHYEASNFDILRYDVSSQTYLQKLNIAANNLGLKLPEKLLFRDESLRTHKFNNEDIPASLQTIWDELNDIAI